MRNVSYHMAAVARPCCTKATEMPTHLSVHLCFRYCVHMFQHAWCTCLDTSDAKKHVDNVLNAVHPGGALVH